MLEPMKGVLHGKESLNVLLGVTGSVAAHKAIDVASALVACGNQVQVVMTEAARRFVGDMALASLTKRPVIHDIWAEDRGEVLHVTVPQWADIVVVAPASADFIAKVVHGFADDSLSAMLLATEQEKIKLFFPAMNTNMWRNPITEANVRRLRCWPGFHVIDPDSGTLACGATGEGKLKSTREIVECVEKYKRLP